MLNPSSDNHEQPMACVALNQSLASRISVFGSLAVFGLYALLYQMQLTIKRFHISDKLFGSGAQIGLLCLAFAIISLVTISAIAQYRQPISHEKYNFILRKRSDALAIFGSFFCLASIGLYSGHLFNPLLPNTLPLLLLAAGLMAFGCSRHLSHRSGRFDHRKSSRTSIGAAVMLMGCLSISLLGYQAFVPKYLNPFGVKMMAISLMAMSSIFSLFIALSSIYLLYKRTHENNEMLIFNKEDYDTAIQKYIPHEEKYKIYILSSSGPTPSKLHIYQFSLNSYNSESYKFLEAAENLYLSLKDKTLSYLSDQENKMLYIKIEEIYKCYIKDGAADLINLSHPAKKKFIPFTTTPDIKNFLKGLKEAYNEIYKLFSIIESNYIAYRDKKINANKAIHDKWYILGRPILSGIVVLGVAVITDVCLGKYAHIYFSLSSALLYITALALLGGFIGYAVGTVALKHQIASSSEDNINEIGFVA